VKRKHIILLHIIFWSVILIITGLETIPSIGKKTMNFIVVDCTIYIGSYALVFYLYYLFISKKHFDKKKITLLTISGLLFVLLITVTITYFYIYVLFKNVFDMSGKKYLLSVGKTYFSFLQLNFMFGMAGSLLKIALLWYDNVMKQKEIEKQFITGELALLRSQINPQFLLSTLANIKSLIERLPEKAISSIENLSEIMSYMLYETSAEKVLIDDEIININNYLNLQRVRYNPDFVRFDVAGDTGGLLIPPLLFMPFIENAFKYGDGFFKSPGIIINLEIRKNNLSFEIMNYIKENLNPVKSDDGFSSKSIKRRLDLLFENNYSMETLNNGTKYFLKLKIKLSE
jgi:two-component system, LytTR family, sensor kinase